MQKPTFNQSKKYFNLPEKTRKEYHEKRKDILDQIKLKFTYTKKIINFDVGFVIGSLIGLLFCFVVFPETFLSTLLYIRLFTFILIPILLPICILLDFINLIYIATTKDKELWELRQKYLGK